MSRSYRKPYLYITGYKPETLRQDKNRSNRIVRHTNNLEDLPDGNYYRKIDDKWGWCTDGGKGLGEGEKLKRK